VRVEVARQTKELSEALSESEALLDQLWSQVPSLSREPGDKILLRLYIQSLNEVIDLHSRRLTVGLQYHIPESIWLALYFIFIMGMVEVGYYFGLMGGGNFLISLMLCFAFSTVILLIADIDRAREGLLTVNQKPILELQQKLGKSAK
jgi:hypothetical protein